MIARLLARIADAKTVDQVDDAYFEANRRAMASGVFCVEDWDGLCWVAQQEPLAEHRLEALAYAQRLGANEAEEYLVAKLARKLLGDERLLEMCLETSR